MQVGIHGRGRRGHVLGGTGLGRGHIPTGGGTERAARPGAGPSTVRSRVDKHVGPGGGQDPWRCWVSGLQGPMVQKENKSGFLG